MKLLHAAEGRPSLSLPALVSGLALSFLLVACKTTDAPPIPPPSPASVIAGATKTTVASATPLSTPSPTASATPTATPTLTATPSPTPTPDLAQRLREADRLAINGNYTEAAAAYEAFLLAYPDHPLAADAAFGLGKTLFLDDRMTLAAATLTALAENTDYVERHPEVLYWLGKTHAALQQMDEAGAAFLAYAERRPQLADQAYLAAGNAYAVILDTPNALASYEQALAHAPDLRAALRAREGIASVSMQAGDPATAASQYKAILDIARNATYRAEIYYLLGQAQAALGEEEAALESFRRAANTAPSSRFAYNALIELVNAEQAVDDLLRGRIDLAAGAYYPAITALNNYLTNTPNHDGTAHALIARAYEGLGDFANADVAWRQLIATHPGDKAEGEAWLGRARSYWRRDDPETARQLYLETAARRPDPSSAAAALWWAGIITERDEERLAEAADIFSQLARDFPENKRAPRAAFKAGLNYYRLGDYASARGRWSELAAMPTGLWSAAADYWLGKLALAENDEAGAITHWRAVAERWGVGNYYGLRAAQQVRDLTGDDLTTAPTPDPNSDTLSALSDWLLSWHESDRPIDLEAASPSLERATELHRAGEFTLAYREFETLRNRWKNDPVRLMQLALHTARLGYHNVSIRAAARVQALSTIPLTRTPLYLQKLIYPLPYKEIILAAAQKYNVDPYTFLGLVRQESLFGSSAVSVAAASGLTQVIPSTGRSIAQQLDWPDYRDELLFRPYISVEFGAFYLAQGLKRSKGSIPEALAGYNGGPGNATFWRGLAGADDDLYLELVNFDETQSYLRAIPVQANFYRRLYPQLVATPTP